MSWRLSTGRPPPLPVSPTEALSWRLTDPPTTQPPQGQSVGAPTESAPPADALSWSFGQPSAGPIQQLTEEMMSQQHQSSNPDFQLGFWSDPPTCSRAPCPSAPSVILDEEAPPPTYDEHKPETPPPSYEEVVQGSFMEKTQDTAGQS